ncbi:MAG: hypothetical protein E6R04_01140 [Spirochaetes bacterium]|nr:MAG: hypothetical protein E6R04_01140 [Spirochaetota bacterium]
MKPTIRLSETDANKVFEILLAHGLITEKHRNPPRNSLCCNFIETFTRSSICEIEFQLPPNSMRGQGKVCLEMFREPQALHMKVDEMDEMPLHMLDKLDAVNKAFAEIKPVVECERTLCMLKFDDVDALCKVFDGFTGKRVDRELARHAFWNLQESSQFTIDLGTFRATIAMKPQGLSVSGFEGFAVDRETIALLEQSIKPFRPQVAKVTCEFVGTLQ